MGVVMGKSDFFILGFILMCVCLFVFRMAMIIKGSNDRDMIVKGHYLDETSKFCSKDINYGELKCKLFRYDESKRAGK